MKKISTVLGLAGLGITVVITSIVVVGCRRQPVVTSNSAPSEHASNSSHDDASAPTGGLSAHTTKLEFKTQPKTLTAGEPAIWMLKIFDKKTNEPVRNFEIVHDRLMRLIVVSKDLSWFNQIHPEYKDHGLFITRTSVPHGGTYKLYAQYTPRQKAPEMAQQEVTVRGASNTLPAKSSLVADKLDKSGSITKTVSGNLSQDTYQFGVTVPMYRVTLNPLPSRLVTGQTAILRFQVRDQNGKIVIDLEPYADAMGHVVIISSDSNTYLHAQPSAAIGVSDGREPGLQFNTNFPAAGLYKVWGQFYRQGQIITAPFVLRVEGVGTTRQAAYSCLMHPAVTSSDPKFTCAKCGGMKLVKRA